MADLVKIVDKTLHRDLSNMALLETDPKIRNDYISKKKLLIENRKMRDELNELKNDMIELKNLIKGSKD